MIKKKTIKRLNYEKAMATLSHEKKSVTALRKELVDKDTELNSRLQKQHEFQMKMLEELKENKAIATDIKTYNDFKQTLSNIKMQEAELGRAIAEKSRLMMDFGAKEKNYIEEIQVLKNKISELGILFKAKENESKEVVRKFDREKDFHIRREINIKKMELERDLDEKYNTKNAELKKEYETRIQRLNRDSEDTMKRYEAALKEKEHSLIEALSKGEKIVKSKEIELLSIMNENAHKLSSLQIEHEKSLKSQAEELKSLQTKYTKLSSEVEASKGKESGRIKILEDQLKLKDVDLDKQRKENELRLIELRKSLMRGADEVESLLRAKIEELSRVYWQEKEDMLKKYETKLKEQNEYMNAMLAEKDRIISGKNTEFNQVSAELSRKESEVKFIEDKVRVLLDEKSSQSVHFIQEQDAVSAKIRVLETSLAELESAHRITKAENEELSIKLNNFADREKDYRIDRKKITEEIESVYEQKEKMLILEKETSLKDLENRLKGKINESKDALYTKDLIIAGLEKDIASFKSKKQKEKDLNREDLNERVARAVKAEKKETEDLRAELVKKDAELKALKENRYLNEDSIKKELGRTGMETEKIRKDFQLRMDDLEKKFKKERELLEQQAKTARDDAEKLRKEIAIKNMLSNL